MTFKPNLFSGISAALVLTLCFIAPAEAKGGLSLRKNSTSGPVFKAPTDSGVGQPSNRLRGTGEANELTAYCWTISECNTMISDCISVGGQFVPGITDYNTGAVSEGACNL